MKAPQGCEVRRATVGRPRKERHQISFVGGGSANASAQEAYLQPQSEAT